MSAIIPDCYNTVIGITRQDCECLDYTDVPEDYDVSLSGLYLDELEGINFNVAEAAGGCDEFWTRVEKAINSGIMAGRQKIMQAVMSKYSPKWSNFSGNVGSTKYTGIITLTGEYCGVKLYCNDIKDGVFTLEKIGFIFDNADEIKFWVTDNYTGITHFSGTVTPTPNVVTWATGCQGIELPLSNEQYENLEYYVYYEKKGTGGVDTLVPKSNGVTCGCAGSHWCFDKVNPCWASPAAKKDAWRQFLMVGGFQTDTNDVTTLENAGVTNQMNGLVVNGFLTCSPESLLCRDGIDWAYDPVYNAVAWVFCYMAGFYLLNQIKDSVEINRYTMLNREEQESTKAYYLQRVDELCTYIRDSIDIEQTGCLKCRTGQWVGKRGVLL